MGMTKSTDLVKLNIEGKRNVWKNNHPKIDYIFNKANRYLKNGMKITEIGIGDGYLLELLYKNKMKCTGIDISNWLIDFHMGEMIKKDYDIKLITQDITMINTKEYEKQDAVFCVDILEHLEDRNYSMSIRNIYDILRNKALFIGSFPYNEDIEKGMVCCPNCGKTFHRVGHHQSIDLKKLRNSLKGMFEICEFGNVLRPFKTFLSSHLKDLFNHKIRKYVSGGTVYFIARRLH